MHIGGLSPLNIGSLEAISLAWAWHFNGSFLLLQLLVPGRQGQFSFAPLWSDHLAQCNVQWERKVICIHTDPADPIKGSPFTFWSLAYFCCPDVRDSARLRLALHRLCKWEGSTFKIRIVAENSIQVALLEPSASKLDHSTMNWGTKCP